VRSRPTVVVFDMIETVFSLENLRGRLASVGLLRETLEVWLAHILRDAFALEATGVYKPFREIASTTLVTLLAQHPLAGRPGGGGSRPRRLQRTRAPPGRRPRVPSLAQSRYSGRGAHQRELQGGGETAAKIRARKVRGAPDLDRRGSALETKTRGLLARGQELGRRAATCCPGGSTRLGYPWRRPCRPDDGIRCPRYAISVHDDAAALYGQYPFRDRRHNCDASSPDVNSRPPRAAYCPRFSMAPTGRASRDPGTRPQHSKSCPSMSSHPGRM